MLRFSNIDSIVVPLAFKNALLLCQNFEFHHMKSQNILLSFLNTNLLTNAPLGRKTLGFYMRDKV